MSDLADTSAPQEPSTARAPGPDPEELYQQGRRFLLGAGVEKNEGLAIAKFLDASDLGHANAAFKAALMYFTGVGISRNEAEARELARRAVALGGGASLPRDRHCQELLDESLGTANASRLLLDDEVSIERAYEQSAQRKKLFTYGLGAAALIVVLMAVAGVFYFKAQGELETPPAGGVAAVISPAETDQAAKESAVFIAQLRAAAAGAAATAQSTPPRTNDF